MGYTDASAWRRARAAQAVVRCPEALERLEGSQVNLCTLGRVHKFITPAVLEEISGKSRAEVELIAAAYDAKGASPDRTRPVMVPKVTAQGCSNRPESAGPPPATGAAKDRLRGEVGAAAPRDVIPLRSEVTTSAQNQVPPLRSEVASQRLEFEQKWKIEAVVSKEVKTKLDRTRLVIASDAASRCKSLLSRKYPHSVNYDVLLGELAELFLERMDPERRQHRRKQPDAIQKRPTKVTSKTPESRYIPAREKEKVWIRDKGRCAYVGTTGKRCNSTYNLQLDHHPVPFAWGGPSRASNLRLLCAKHNRYTAEKIFGRQDYKNSTERAVGGKHEEKVPHRRE